MRRGQESWYEGVKRGEAALMHMGWDLGEGTKILNDMHRYWEQHTLIISAGLC